MRTKPHTIRFDEEKLPEALKKAETDKVQRLVDILIDDFVKDETEMIKEIPEGVNIEMKPPETLLEEIKGYEYKPEKKKVSKVKKTYLEERFEAKNKL